jgi:hypothetical protein
MYEHYAYICIVLYMKYNFIKLCIRIGMCNANKCEMLVYNRESKKKSK